MQGSWLGGGRTAWSAQRQLCSLDSKCYLLLQAAYLNLSTDFYTIWKSDKWLKMWVHNSNGREKGHFLCKDRKPMKLYLSLVENDWANKASSAPGHLTSVDEVLQFANLHIALIPSGKRFRSVHRASSHTSFSKATTDALGCNPIPFPRSQLWS